jgi:hypothetical protein
MIEFELWILAFSIAEEGHEKVIKKTLPGGRVPGVIFHRHGI